MRLSFFILFFSVFYLPLRGQYTDIINSNQPGNSQSAYAVGRGVLQFEGGFWFEQQKNANFYTENTRTGLDYSVRYGFLSDKLELIVNGTFAYDVRDYFRFFNERSTHLGFVNNTLGAKYLLYDPYVDEKPNLYSWKANNSFNWKKMIPAIGVYAGMNFLTNSVFFYEEVPSLSPKAVVMLQSHPMPRVVLVGNLIANRFLSKYPEWGYVFTLTHSLDNGRFSVFIESEGIQNHYHSDHIMHLGGAYLFTKDIQVNVDLGMSTKSTPSRYMALLGFSYRIDNHKKYLLASETEKLEPTKIKSPKRKKKWLLF